MATGDWLRALGESLTEQVSATHALASVLEAEARALLHQDLDQLDAITGGKQQCIESLERIEAERRSLVAAYAGCPQPENLVELLRQADGSGRLSAQWCELVGLLETCRARNVQNGRLVAIRRANVVRSLAMLRGAEAAVTYGPGGQSSPTGGMPRELARA